MKARIGGRTTLDSLPAAYREAVKACAYEAAEKRWAEVQEIASDRVMYALALTLNDKLGYREKGIKMIIEAFSEIITGYGDQCFTPQEDRIGTDDLERAANAMKAELADRGIVLEWD